MRVIYAYEFFYLLAPYWAFRDQETPWPAGGGDVEEGAKRAAADVLLRRAFVWDGGCNAECRVLIGPCDRCGGQRVPAAQ